jgi:hypothetical protein
LKTDGRTSAKLVQQMRKVAQEKGLIRADALGCRATSLLCRQHAFNLQPAVILMEEQEPTQAGS